MQIYQYLNLTKILFLWVVLTSTAYSQMSIQVPTSKITGQDELYSADVIQEDGLNKLVTKTTIVPELANIFQEHAQNAGSSDLTVNGSLVAPINFEILSDPTLDKIVQVCLIYFDDNGIKLQNFAGLNNPLTNGLLFSLNSGGTMVSFSTIHTTTDINNHFSTEPFQLIFASGGDYVAGRFRPDTPFVLKAGSADFVRISVRDNLSTVTGGELVCEGILE